jgi:hypothetical protein
MLHPVPDSTHRKRLLRVVVLQRRLIKELCDLPVGTTVDLTWLQGIWRELEAEWVRRFWENDEDKTMKQGRRSIWITRIASATETEKQTIRSLAEEQIRFPELWSNAPVVRMRQQNWKTEPFKSVSKLLVSFYAPIFYDSEGYKFGQLEFSKSDFLDGIPKASRKVCPYCDNFLQKAELDHFLPKDDFPFLSCHPDNLIPSCHDSNSGSHKGTVVPLDWTEQDQATHWFHPRCRTARNQFVVSIVENPDRTLAAALRPANGVPVNRVTNLDATFKLANFWSGQIEDELQLIGSQVSDLLREEALEPTEVTIRTKLLSLANLKANEIGRRGLALCHHALYTFAANSTAVVTEITRACMTERQLGGTA